MLAVLLWCCVGWIMPVLASDSHVLVLGRISDNPKAHYEQLKPLLDYVVPRMADVGIREGRVLMARDTQQMQSYMRRGRVDWVTETTAAAVLLQQRSGAEPLLLTERDGVSSYSTVYFAHRDAGIGSLQDLAGRSIAFQNRSSTSAYYIPATELLARGMRMEILLSPMDRPAPGSVGYVFARTELNLSSWVHKRLVDAGAMSNLDWADERRVPASFKRDFVLIRETPPYPRALEMVRGDLDPRVKRRLREVLLAAADDPDAREALLQFFKTTRFLPLDSANEHALEHLKQGVMRITAELE
ncbi:phosphate/phosphite/phosphonate ABC transporter substrate-binding protein [Luteimonas aestuarii]|uniref:Phosphate/phosphite/phosphonate ABC transporter substrate-binding protein n=1 Tax=Luteimonas aestuarii TaxID=453837 RepID=A0A4R5TY80_9GAMM|nr:phosphate/phosphite/phosphonate ABC transporter substrate-binding protein [Luteimonas aestuarii]TDK26143.1 phosphate/phosphite/phosphonate ABC transporter substrate-binding protein [Luteimonas aestuarii]